MNTEPREPSRLPIRGALGLIGTVGALTLLLSFRGAPSIGDVVVANEGETEASDELITGTTTESSATEAVAGPVTLTGAIVETMWGDVQVAVTLDGSDITDVQSLLLPDGDRRSSRISDYVSPVLSEEAIAYDTADVSVISGATYTSQAYAKSLQSALDQRDGSTSASLSAEAEPEPVQEPGTDPSGSDPVIVTGDPVAIRWGDVQVAVTLEGGDITDVQAIALPDGDRHSAQISDYIEPLLRDEAITHDTSDVSVISGATYTSRAYAASLQSALDQLGV